jgi:Cu+-exporting ATPase
MMRTKKSGAAVAMEAGGITLLKSDLRGILRARHLSKSTMHNIRENLFFAFVCNAAGVQLAAGVLFPAFGLRSYEQLDAGVFA